MNLSKIFLVILILGIIPFASAAVPDPGHGAEELGPGTFSAGNYAFPNNLSINGNANVAGGAVISGDYGGVFGLRVEYPVDFRDGGLWGNGGPADAFKVNSSTNWIIGGNLGIGTTTPAELLSVKNESADSVPRISLTNDALGLFIQVNGADSNKFQFLDNTGFDTFLEYYKDTDTKVGVQARNLLLRGNVIANELGDAKSFRIESDNDANNFVSDGVNDRIGIGTNTPANKLNVIGDLNVTGVSYLGNIVINADNITVNNLVPKSGGIINVPGDFNVSGTVYAHNYSANSDITFINSSGGIIAIIQEIGGLILGGAGSSVPMSVSGDLEVNNSVFFVNSTSGKVGIGTSNPEKIFHIKASQLRPGIFLQSTGTDGATIKFNDTDSNMWEVGLNSIGDFVFGVTGADYLTIQNTTGNLGIGTSTPANKLHVIGNANITNNLYVGGNITSYGADFAEMMYSDEILAAGDVVCLKENGIGKCIERADKKVIGIVSSKPTIIGGLGNGNYPVAVVGIVKAKIIGPVQKGDLLTSSVKEGYAEKATISDFGAIVGKAMESCTGNCIVKIMVTLK